MLGKAHLTLFIEVIPYVVGEATQNQDDLIEKFNQYKNQSVTDSISNINKGNLTNILDVDSETDEKEDSKDEKEVKTKTISSDLA